MISFVVALVLLVVGYLFYGRFIEKVFGPDDRPTPAVSKADGVDYIVLPSWKIFMIQFLNIAGTGPIFGAIMGAKFGPVAYLWIVFGCIFAGAVHDYLSGMLSIRHGGANLPDLVGKYLGKITKQVMLIFSVVLLTLMIIAVGCGADKRKENEQSIPTITKAEAQAKLNALSAGLEYRYDDMKEKYYYRCNADMDVHPHIWLIPYVTVDKNYNVFLGFVKIRV